MPITRRLFLQSAVAAAAAPPNAPPLDPNTLQKFVDPLPILGVAKKAGYWPAPENPAHRVPYYRLEMKQLESKLHRDLPPSRVWGFDGFSPGPTLEMRSGEGAWIEWVNGLPLSHFLPIDHSLHGAEEDKPEVRAVIHVHGAKAPPESDGYPENWYTPGKSATYYYPNDQEAAMLWYHDHAMGINRLNIYAGLFGVYLLRDEAEDALNLPKGEFEISLVIYDRFLRQDGQLDYPVSGKAGAPWVPEVFGKAMLANGKLCPYLDVEPRRYRLRLLNAANARFYHLALANGQEFHLIGTDQGLLPAPARLKSFVLAPAERVDVVLDFKDHAGEQIVLNSDSFELMQFRVGRTKTTDASSLPPVLRPIPKIAESAAIKTRLLTIDEYQNRAEEPTLMLLNRSHWSLPVTENPVLNSVEIWTIVNPTDDSHPIHLHLVRFQILDRRRFDSLVYRMSGQLRYTGPAEPPEANEAGWKDTVRAHSSMVTRIIVRFEGFAGRYVWHCHILEHEDNEMMRPYDVLPSAG